MKIALTLHQPLTPSSPQKSSADDETASSDVPTLRMTTEAMKKLNSLIETEEEKEDKDKPALPPHIEALLEQREKIKDQIKEQKEQLEKIKARDDLDDETKMTLLQQQADYLVQLNVQLMGITQSLQEALKEAGISDMSLLADILA